MLTPFFILGNPRSGTSLFRLMLNSHPNIIVPPESGFLLWWYEKYKNWSKDNSLNENEVKAYVKDLMTSKKIEEWNLDPDKLTLNILKYKPKNYGELSTQIYLSYKRNLKTNILTLGDKNNYYIHHLSTIHEIYPKSKYIHIIRDGRDVACSYKKIRSLKSNSPYKPNLVYDIQDIAKEWNENINKIDKFLINKQNLKIRYEDLILNTKHVLTVVCNFLDIDFHPDLLNYFKPEFNDEPSSSLDWKMKTLLPLDPKNINKFINILSNNDLKKFNIIANKSLIANGYEI